MEARIGRVVLIAAVLSMTWMAVGPRPGAIATLVTDLLAGRGVSVFGYEVQVRVHVTRPDETRDHAGPGMACLVDTGHGTLLVFGPHLFDTGSGATNASGHEEVDW